MNHRSQTVTAVLITHNHEAVAEKALSSLQWADEIVVVDQGSTDGTLEIVRRYTDQLFYHPSSDRLQLQQFAFQKAREEWIFYLEPHEWVEEMLRHKIDGVLLNANGANGFRVPIQLYWKGKKLRHGRFMKSQCRLFRKKQVQLLDDVYLRGFQLKEGDCPTLEQSIASEPYADITQLFEAMNRVSDEGALHFVEQAGANTLKSGFLGQFKPYWHAKWNFIARLFFSGALWDGFPGVLLAYAESHRSLLKHAKAQSLVQESAALFATSAKS